MYLLAKLNNLGIDKKNNKGEEVLNAYY